jgi:simple sugar transport system ATP-binding protein
MQPMPTLLEIRGLCKTFPGVKALDNVDFVLRRGEIHTLMGENGAGKSTLIKVLTGVYPADGGTMVLDGSPMAPHSPAHAQSLGVSAVYQEVSLIPHLSVAENLYLGRQPMKWHGINWKEIHRRARAALARLDLHIDVTQPLHAYSIAIGQMVAIARALDLSAKVLVLDEPTSSLDLHEVEQLFAVMRRLKNQGMGIVFVSHFLEQVYAISDRFTVLRNGRLVGEYETARLPRVELIAKMIGKPMAELPRRAELGTADVARRMPLLRARGFGKKGSLAPFDLDLQSGEVVGLAGLLGSGRTEMALLLFGIDRADSGSLEINGKPVRMTSPRRAVALGLGFLPEDRKTQGIIPDLSLRENIILALQASKGWLRNIPRSEQSRLARQHIAALGIATPDAERPIKLLSGGNQQKAILARWLAAHPKLLILDEPTRGIDVGAKAEIETLVASLCAQGMAIVFISSELDEVVRASHRVIVLRDRVKIAELQDAQIDAILHAIAVS